MPLKTIVVEIEDFLSEIQGASAEVHSYTTSHSLFEVAYRWPDKPERRFAFYFGLYYSGPTTWKVKAPKIHQVAGEQKQYGRLQYDDGEKQDKVSIIFEAVERVVM